MPPTTPAAAASVPAAKNPKLHIPNLSDVELAITSLFAGDAHAATIPPIVAYLVEKHGRCMMGFSTEITRLVQKAQAKATVVVAAPPTSMHQAHPKNPKPAFIRTALCNRGDSCPYYDVQTQTANGCWFAHTSDELRCRAFAENRCRDPNCTLKHTLVLTDLVIPASHSDPDGAVDFEGERPKGATAAGGRSLKIVIPFPYFDMPKVLQAQVGRNREQAVKNHAFLGHDYLQARYGLGVGGGPLSLYTAMETREPNIQLYKDLLMVEVCQCKNDVRRYDINNSVVTYTGKKTPSGQSKLYAIKCPGLSEKRPSVLVGDAVLARDNRTEAVHLGYIHQVCQAEVHVAFHRAFDAGPTKTHLVTFSAPMTAYIRQFYALEHAPITLSPDVINARAIATHSPTYEINKALAQTLNDEQQVAVRRIAGSTQSADANNFRLFVLHGPPGTGKTTTVVAAIVNMLLYADRNPGAARPRILVCTPTNHAANLIVDKIASRYTRASRACLIRLVADGVVTNDVDKKLVKKFFATRHSVGIEELLLADIVVTTIVSSGMLFQCGVPNNHFDHIIVDEAGQATVPELAVPLLLAGGKCPAITLAGDHKQLGPVLRSLASQYYDLQKSSMELIMQNDNFSAEYSVQLVRSYRSHPHIMRLYNELTYKGALVSAAVPEKTDTLLKCGLFPNSGVPLGFMHVDGPESRESDSPSWMNMGEVTCVTWLLRQFLDKGVGGVAGADIVVLSPYQKQCRKIRESIQKEFTYEVSQSITVCSIESFQGREAAVVILSCVRSLRVDEKNNDIVQGIGFLSQPKRLNVAISRAIAGLYIVGNIGLLQTDDGWRALIDKMVEVEAIRDRRRHMTAADVCGLREEYEGRMAEFKRNPKPMNSAGENYQNHANDAAWRRSE